MFFFLRAYSVPRERWPETISSQIVCLIYIIFDVLEWFLGEVLANRTSLIRMKRSYIYFPVAPEFMFNSTSGVLGVQSKQEYNCRYAIHVFQMVVTCQIVRSWNVQEVWTIRALYVQHLLASFLLVVMRAPVPSPDGRVSTTCNTKGTGCPSLSRGNNLASSWS